MEAIKVQTAESEFRFKEMEKMYSTREQELRVQLSRQANHSMEVNDSHSIGNVLKKQNQMLQRKLDERETESTKNAAKIAILEKEKVQLTSKLAELTDKLEKEARLLRKQ